VNIISKVELVEFNLTLNSKLYQFGLNTYFISKFEWILIQILIKLIILAYSSLIILHKFVQSKYICIFE